jgi:predicted dehydrogenase
MLGVIEWPVAAATPDRWHAPITLAAMESDKDVYVEKPMTQMLEENKVVAHKAKDLRRIVQVGVQGLSWPRWHKSQKIVQSGIAGQAIAVQGTYSCNDPAGDWNWPIDPAAGPDATGENHINWKQCLGPAPKIQFSADRFFRLVFS